MEGLSMGTTSELGRPLVKSAAAQWRGAFFPGADGGGSIGRADGEGKIELSGGSGGFFRRRCQHLRDFLGIELLASGSGEIIRDGAGQTTGIGHRHE